MTLGDKIKNIRETARMSQREFAKEIKCAQSSISAFEMDQKRPSYDTLKQIHTFAKKHKIKIDLLG